MPKPRSPRSFLLEAIEASDRAIYLLDSHRKLRFANRFLRDRLGVVWSRLENRALRSESMSLDPETRAWIECLCPPPHVLGGVGGSYTVYPPEPLAAGGLSAAGVSSPMRATCLPWTRGETTRWCVTWTEFSPEAERGVSRVRELQEAWATRSSRRADRGVEMLSGDSAPAIQLRERVNLASGTAIRVSITGPAGSHHERLARWIHARRPDTVRGPLIALDCTLLDAELLQTTYRELVRSARREERAPGCLLLTQIDRLAESGQLELLNLLRFPQVPFTTLVTSRMPLGQLADQEVFDRELADRLETLAIEIPSLSSRRDDIPLLAHGLLAREVQEGRSSCLGWSDDSLGRLQRYGWPGNFHELEELVSRLAETVSGAWVQPSDLPRRLTQTLDSRESSQFRLEPMDLEQFLKGVEAEIISLALSQSGGNKTKAARLLGLSRGGFHRRLDVASASQAEDSETSPFSDEPPSHG